MKKLILIATIAFASFSASAQCTPGNYTASGIYPDTTTNFVSGCKGVPYSQTITNVVPEDTTYMGQNATINYIQVASITGLPTGLNFECNVTDCKFPGGETNCGIITGTTTEVGTFSLVFNLTANGNINIPPVGSQTIDLPYTANGYKIVIEDCGSTASTIELTENATFSIFPNPAKDAITINNLSNDMMIKNISIINAAGQVVHTYATNQTSLEINTSELKSGVYFVSVKQNNAKQTLKLIVE